jgi:hypothetical protein
MPSNINRAIKKERDNSFFFLWLWLVTNVFKSEWQGNRDHVLLFYFAIYIFLYLYRYLSFPDNIPLTHRQNLEYPIST